MATLNFPSLLLVEGTGDKHVIRELWLSHHSDTEIPFQIEPADGIDNLLARVEAEVEVEGRTAIGFVLDADNEIEDMRRALTDRLHRAGLATIETREWDSLGLVKEREGGPRVGAWLMPDNTRNGEIEDLLWAMIPEQDALRELAINYVAEVIHTDRRFPEPKKRRAEVHSWLAVQQQPYPTGQAVRAGKLDANAPIATAFVRWLDKLFVDSP